MLQVSLVEVLREAGLHMRHGVLHIRSVNWHLSETARYNHSMLASCRPTPPTCCEACCPTCRASSTARWKLDSLLASVSMC